jgi:WD40 repeat protein
VNGTLFSSSSDETIRQWDLSVTVTYNFFLLSQTGSLLQEIHDLQYRGSIKDFCVTFDDLSRIYRLLCSYGESVRYNGVASEQDELGTKCIHVWQIKEGGKAKKVDMWKDHHANIVSVLISRLHKNRLFTGSIDKTIRIWDVSTGECIQVLRNDKAVVTFMYNTDDRIYVGSG